VRYAVRPLIGVYPTLGPFEAVGRRGAGPAPVPWPFSEPGLRLTHLGRGAVWLALKALGMGPGRRLAMPSFHCGAEVDAARLAGVEVVFYRVAPSLEVDEDDLAKVAAGVDAVYLISHFGFPPPARPPNVLVIEDIAHGMFSLDGDGLALGTGADAVIFCPRKSLGVPDGGAVLVADGTNLPEPSGRPPAQGVARSVVSLLVGRAALSGHAAIREPAVAALAKVSRADAAAAEGRLTAAVIGEWGMEVADVERAASRPSRLTERIVGALDTHDASSVRDRRRANYAALADALAQFCPEAYRRLPEGVCPLYFPVRCARRSAAIVRLLGRGVRAVEVWPVAHPLLDRDRFSELDPLRHELLALPVHQDMEPWHVELVADAASDLVRP
jgi:dTDP-4-amino-4,6-dideoxygalactose transaminase